MVLPVSGMAEEMVMQKYLPVAYCIRFLSLID
jgi:hypothetical protein